MKEQHKFINSISKSMKMLLVGNVSFIERKHDWLINVDLKWNKRKIIVLIKLKCTSSENDFVSFSLNKSDFISIITRSETYKSSGDSSDFSDLLLESPSVNHLMRANNPSIKLEGRSIIYSGSIRKKDMTSLSNIFKLIEELMLEFNYKFNKRLY